MEAISKGVGLKVLVLAYVEGRNTSNAKAE